MSSEDTQNAIAKLQSDIDALQKEIEQANDRNQPEVVAGLQQRIKEHTDQITRLQSQYQQEIKQEQEEAVKKAQAEQKKDDADGFIEMCLVERRQRCS